MKQAMTGIHPAQRIYFDHRQQALEKLALAAGTQPNNSGKYDDIMNLTDEELMSIAAKALKKK
jgi:hypothetical protein